MCITSNAHDRERLRDLTRLYDHLFSWVVKEAAYKSLSLHFPRLTWKHLDLTTTMPLSRIPSLRLTPAFRSVAASDKGIKERDVKLHVSISHDGEYVVGFVVAERVSDNVSDE